MEETTSTPTIRRSKGQLVPAIESPTYDPVLNLKREASLAGAVEVPSFRVWRSTDSVVLGKFLEPDREVNLSFAAERGVPVLRRTSGGGAVYHDLGNINYSIYLPGDRTQGFSIEKSLWLLSFPVTELLDTLGVEWSWDPPNNIYVGGAKISGSAQARSRGRLLHHGTLLVSTNLDKMHKLLKPGGRSRIAPVVNLSEVVPGMTPEGATVILADILETYDLRYIAREECPPLSERDNRETGQVF